MGFDNLLNAFAATASVGAVIYISLGIVIGFVFGVIPGLGGVIALALVLPFTYVMEPLHAIYLAGGIMGATSFGGSISAILLKVPGTAPNAATTFDGFPMAQAGRAGEAIGASATASTLGGLIGLVTLCAIIPFSKQIILAFGPGEQLLLAILAFAAIAAASGDRLLRAFISAGFGLLLATIGFDVITGDERFTFGNTYLWDGIPMVPALTGLFVLAQMFWLAGMHGRIDQTSDTVTHGFSGLKRGIKSTFGHWPVVLRGSLIGTVIGILPGVGGTVASLLAYSAAKSVSREPETFGTGNIVGVIAPESANNAKDGGSLVPTLAFGIPGSAESAVFLSILVLHGIEPGPLMLRDETTAIYGLIVAVTLSAIGASLLGLMLSRGLIVLTRIDTRLIVPFVIALALCGVYAIAEQFGDVLVAIVLGIVGFTFLRFRFPVLPMAVAIILGETAERSYHQVRLISDSNIAGFLLARPQSVILIVMIVGAILTPIVRRRLGRQTTSHGDE